MTLGRRRHELAGCLLEETVGQSMRRSTAEEDREEQISEVDTWTIEETYLIFYFDLNNLYYQEKGIVKGV